MKKKVFSQITAVMLAAALLLGGCGQAAGSEKESSGGADAKTEETDEKTDAEQSTGADVSDAPEIKGFTCESVMELAYATEFDVFYYNDGYKVLDVHDDHPYLIVPEGEDTPEGLDDDMVVLEQPLDHIYMAATAVMSLFDAVDGIDSIKYSGTAADGWYVDSAKAAMEAGEITYAGKYSEPDYEMLVDGECDLAVESTMILHTPKVQEMIEDLDVPVFVDYSSYESHPLGRTEWVKAYGALLNKEEEAESFFAEQAKVMDELEDFENTEKTVAYFYINQDGSVVVRRSEDYIPSMIEIAGGRYIFDDLSNPDSNAPSVKITMEEFYAAAVDADYLIYNGTIDNQVTSLADLTAKSELLSDFKAVQEGNVWYTGRNLYQATDGVGDMIRDIHRMLTGGDTADMSFLEKLK